MKTQIGIIGAGPAGLMLAHLLHAQGVACVVLEARSRAYAEARVRAGVLEQGSVDLLDGLGLGERIHREGLLHHGIEIGFNGARHRIDMSALTGKAVMVYGQHEVVKDLIAAAEQRGIPVLFDVESAQPAGFDGDRPSITFTQNGMTETLQCDFIAGCDGFHVASRPVIPAGVLSTYERVYPFSWLGILADAPPSQEELVSMNSHEVSRFSATCLSRSTLHRLQRCTRLVRRNHIACKRLSGALFSPHETTIVAYGRLGRSR